jgi:acid stress chaperone HdeB
VRLSGRRADGIPFARIGQSRNVTEPLVGGVTGPWAERQGVAAARPGFDRQVRFTYPQGQPRRRGPPQGTAMRLAAGFAAAALLASASASAQTLDLSTIKCSDFLTSGKDNIAVIITWLDGYYKEKDDPPIIDFAKFSANTEKLAKYCADNPGNGLITAADKTLSKD